MYKLIGLILAGVPVALFLRAIFVGHSKKRSQAVSEFKKQMDYFVRVLLILIGCGVAVSIAKLLYQFSS